LKGFEIKTFLEEYSKDQSLKDCDVLVVFILTHGGNNVIYGTDHVPVGVEEIFEMFSDDLCPNMRGKQKIFMINACRGSKYYTVDQ